MEKTLKLKPLSLMTRGERMLMLSLNRGQRAAVQRLDSRGGPNAVQQLQRRQSSNAHPSSDKSLLLDHQKEPLLNAGYPAAVVSQNDNADSSCHAMDSPEAPEPQTDKSAVFSLESEQAFASGILASSSYSDLVTSENAQVGQFDAEGTTENNTVVCEKKTQKAQTFNRCPT